MIPLVEEIARADGKALPDHPGKATVSVLQ
jgi:hypothetical protein